MAKKRNPALDNWLDRSSAVNKELAEDPEAREAAIAQSKEAGERIGDSTDETDPETQPEAVETTGAESDDDAAIAARKAEDEAAAAAKVEARKEASPEAVEDERAENQRLERDRLKKEREEARRQLAEARRTIQELQAKQTATAAPAAVAEPERKAPEDPEPNADTHPIEHDQWLAREARREAQAAREDTRKLREEINQLNQGSQAQRMEAEFLSLIEVEKIQYREEHPDIDDRLAHVKKQLRRQYQINGLPTHQIEAKLRQDETQFLARMTALATQNGEPYPGQWALEKLSEQAEVYGYSAAEARAATETANGGARTAKAAPTASERIADTNKRAIAARTASTMSADTAEVLDSKAEMTAEKFLRMSPEQRAIYKRKNPGTLDRLMSEGEESRPGNFLLAGR